MQEHHSSWCCRPAAESVRPSASSSQLQPAAPSIGEQNKRKSAPTNGVSSQNAPVAPSRSQRRKHQQRAALVTNDDGSDGGSAGSRSDADLTPASRAVGDQRGSQRRRSARHRNYLNRSQLHEAIELPDGYGEWLSDVTVTQTNVKCQRCAATLRR